MTVRSLENSLGLGKSHNEVRASISGFPAGLTPAAESDRWGNGDASSFHGLPTVWMSQTVSSHILEVKQPKAAKCFGMAEASFFSFACHSLCRSALVDTVPLSICTGMCSISQF